MIGLTVRAQNLDEFAYRIGKLRELVRAGLVDPEVGTITMQARLLAEHCMKLTPPRNLQQGKKRVQRDLEKIFHPVAPSEMESKSLRKIVRAGDAEAWDAFARNVRRGPFAQTQATVPTDELHRKNRDNRGRARRTNFVTLYPHQRTLRDMIRSNQDNVGWAKAGWLRGYIGLGGTRAPDWVMRHTPGNGTFTDARFAADPMVAVYNTTSWGKKHNEAERIVSNSLKARASAMRSYFERTMKLAADGKTPYQMQQAAIAEQFAA